MAIVAALPWKVVLKALPTIVVTARQLWQNWESRPEVSGVNPKADVQTQLASVMERLTALEGAETDQARLLTQMADQLHDIARRAAVGYWLGLTGLVLSCGALLLALLIR